VRDFFARAHGELEQMLHDTSRLLSNLTDYAAVVIAPSHGTATIRSIQLVGLGPRIALLVAVLSDGAIEKRTLELAAEVSDPQLAAATARLSTGFIGHTLASLLAMGPSASGDDTIDGLADAAVDALVGGHQEDGDQVFVDGTARVAAAFDAVGTVRQVLTILEQQYVIVTLLQDVLDRGLSVAIGTETGMQPLADCSLVVAPYTVEGQPAGTVGVLGPTRMRYDQALAAVAVVSKRLGKALTEG
jgi:heat-inducible transcriptional repressor